MLYCRRPLTEGLDPGERLRGGQPDARQQHERHHGGWPQDGVPGAAVVGLKVGLDRVGNLRRQPLEVGRPRVRALEHRDGLLAPALHQEPAGGLGHDREGQDDEDEGHDDAEPQHEAPADARILLQEGVVRDEAEQYAQIDRDLAE